MAPGAPNTPLGKRKGTALRNGELGAESTKIVWCVSLSSKISPKTLTFPPVLSEERHYGQCHDRSGKRA